MYDILKYIHNNIRCPLSAADVAKQFGYSKWYFCDRFKSFTGRTFVEYVRHYRIQLAALDILSGDKVMDVALSYGYDSVGGFNKAFLKEYGCSPKEYARQVRECQLYYEQRRISMYPLSDRCAALREEAVHKKSYASRYNVQRNVYFTIGKVEALHAGMDMGRAIAEGLAVTLEKFTPVIQPGERIVGFNFADPERQFPKDTAEDRLIMAQNGISPEDMERYLAVADQINYHPNPAAHAPMTRQEREADREWAAIGRCIDSNHTVLNYQAVLELGFSGLEQQVLEQIRTNGASPLYDSALRICRAAQQMGDKYAAEAKRLLESEDPAYQPEDLQSIIATCSTVPRQGAKNLQQAMQALWFAHIINTWEDFINANSLGRLDQILYPYYRAQIDEGTLTKEEAFELICCLWLKLYRDYDVQQSCIGGTAPDGSSQVNALSYMMLDATEQLDFVRCMSVRYGANTEKAFLRRALEVVGHVQKGVPFFFNDDVMIPALVSKGIPYADACGYTQIGCVETVIPGKANPHAVTGKANLLKAIEYTLCNGHSMQYPEYAPGIPTGDPESYKTYHQFYEAVQAQIRQLLDLSCSKIVKYRQASIVNSPRPYKSLLTQGCLDSGRDFNDGGALYDYYQLCLCGIPNLADSLAVIKKFVFEEKRYSLPELKQILEADFPDEAVRLEFIHKSPKYGNDIDEVDQIAADILHFACDELEQLSQKYALSFHAQPFTFYWMLDHGRHSAASPDGRRKGEPIAYSCSSMQGRDFTGLTALFNSIAKLPAKRAPGTTSAIVEVDPKLFCDRNIDTMTDIFIAASQRGVCNVQFNVIDADTLIDAQKHPEHYSNLAVRVSGFSQKFNLLTPELQDHIIGRTKHTCL